MQHNLSKTHVGKKRKENPYQQNSNLQGGVHVMCMHPWFFSIGRLHLGHGFELASILQVKLTVSSGSQITTIQKAAIYTW
jgi:hypothetical protein